MAVLVLASANAVNDWLFDLMTDMMADADAEEKTGTGQKAKKNDKSKSYYLNQIQLLLCHFTLSKFCLKIFKNNKKVLHLIWGRSQQTHQYLGQKSSERTPDSPGSGPQGAAGGCGSGCTQGRSWSDTEGCAAPPQTFYRLSQSAAGSGFSLSSLFSSLHCRTYPLSLSALKSLS